MDGILGNDIEVRESELLDLINYNSLYTRSQIEWYDKFCRFGCINPWEQLNYTREYIFITKPDLHIFETSKGNILNSELAHMPLWTDAMERYPEVLKSLQLSANDPTDCFVNIFTNGVTSTLDLPGITAGEIETNENIYGTHMTYRKSSLTQDEHHDFTLDFLDTKYLELYMWFKLYDEYCKLKDLGKVSPVNDSYTLDRILYEQMAAYKFIVGEDGETLLYWAKLWGVYPKSVPRDVFSDLSTQRDGLKISVNFHGNFVDDLDPTILAEFNQIALDNGTLPEEMRRLPLFNREKGRLDPRWAKGAYIVRDDRVPSNQKYKLKWRI